MICDEEQQNGTTKRERERESTKCGSEGGLTGYLERKTNRARRPRKRLPGPYHARGGEWMMTGFRLRRDRVAGLKGWGWFNAGTERIRFLARACFLLICQLKGSFGAPIWQLSNTATGQMDCSVPFACLFRPPQATPVPLIAAGSDMSGWLDGLRRRAGLGGAAGYSSFFVRSV